MFLSSSDCWMNSVSVLSQTICRRLQQSFQLNRIRVLLSPECILSTTGYLYKCFSVLFFNDYWLLYESFTSRMTSTPRRDSVWQQDTWWDEMTFVIVIVSAGDTRLARPIVPSLPRAHLVWWFCSADQLLRVTVKRAQCLWYGCVK